MPPLHGRGCCVLHARSKWQTMKLCLISSLCEPIAAVVFGVCFNNYLTRYLMSALNAGGTSPPCKVWLLLDGAMCSRAFVVVLAVTGIMIMLCLVELLPAATQLISARV